MSTPSLVPNGKASFDYLTLRVLRRIISVCRMVIDIIRQHLERASGSGRRSTIVSTVIVMGGVLLTGLVGSLWAGAPDWLLEWLVGLLIGDVFLFGFAYVIFMWKNPDALRSERFELEKMVIARSLLGDSLQGSFDPKAEPKMMQFPADPPKKIEGSIE